MYAKNYKTLNVASGSDETPAQLNIFNRTNFTTKQKVGTPNHDSGILGIFVYVTRIKAYDDKLIVSSITDKLKVGIFVIVKLNLTSLSSFSYGIWFGWEFLQYLTLQLVSKCLHSVLNEQKMQNSYMASEYISKIKLLCNVFIQLSMQVLRLFY